MYITITVLDVEEEAGKPDEVMASIAMEHTPGVPERTIAYLLARAAVAVDQDTAREAVALDAN